MVYCAATGSQYQVYMKLCLVSNLRHFFFFFSHGAPYAIKIKSKPQTTNHEKKSAVRSAQPPKTAATSYLLFTSVILFIFFAAPFVHRPRDPRASSSSWPARAGLSSAGTR
jgi:hypothetical protein